MVHKLNGHKLFQTNVKCPVCVTVKPENVAINDALPLKAARRDAIANLKCLWGLGHQRLNFDGHIYIHYAAPSSSARSCAIYFFPFGDPFTRVGAYGGRAPAKIVRAPAKITGPFMLKN